MAIYLKNPVTDKGLLSFLEDGFSAQYGKWFKFKETYYDELCTELECKAARRSFLDLLEICQTYLPDTTDIKLAKALFELENMFCFICNDIGKLVFQIDRNRRHNYGITSSYPDLKGVDGYSFKMIENLTKL